MRKYQPIWIKIKQDHIAKLKAPSSVQGRIITAVRKEKSNDLGWKLLHLEKGIRYKLMNESDGDILTFRLVLDTNLYLADL